MIDEQGFLKPNLLQVEKTKVQTGYYFKVIGAESLQLSDVLDDKTVIIS